MVYPNRITKGENTMLNTFNIEDDINESVSKLHDNNQILGRTLMQPFRPANSGSRSLMNSVHVEQFIIPKNPEMAGLVTGYENEYGENSTSFVTSPANYRVIAKVDKFSFKPGFYYYLIVQDIDTGVYDVIERCYHHHNTESFGYLWRNNNIDKLNIGDTIRKGQVIKTSNGFDEYLNKTNGVNLLTMYVSSAKNLEDSIIISQSAAEKLTSVLVYKTSIMVNSNDILINKYGDENHYQSFPDIGEKIKGGEFCSIRRIDNSNVLYTLSQARLREDMISDKHIIMDGTVVDIDVNCNNKDILESSYYNQQLYFYHNEKQKFSQQINDIVAPLYINGKCTRALERLYCTCRDIVAGKLFYDDGLYDNTTIKITAVQDLPMEPGDKMVDRYGGKGVVSVVIPDEFMPILSNGRRVQVIKNQSTCINRENIGQLHELSLSFIAMRLMDIFKTGAYTATECCKMWYKFIYIIDPLLAEEGSQMVNFDDPYQAQIFLDALLEDDRIIISDQPFSTNINIDTIARIYKEFPFIKQYDVMVPMEDSNGNYRMVKARRPMVVGDIYNYRLKQFAEEKFSVTSLAATNLKNLNTRSKANKVYEAKFPKTPVMFGQMESGDLGHMGVQYVVMGLMLYASSPQARKLFEELLIGNPYDINIQLDKDSKNRNAEIINALIKTMGNELVFKKVPKVKKQLCKRVMCKVVPNHKHHYKTNIKELMGGEIPGEMEMKYNAAIQHDDPNRNPLCKRVMCKIIDKNK